MTTEETMNALKTALQNEEKSEQLYRDVAEKTANPVIKKTMIFLADWEKDHADKIKKLQAHVLGEMQVLDVKTLCDEDSNCTVKEFFGKNIEEFKENLDKGTEDELKVYETGMQIEKEGYDFYTEQAKATDNQEVKQLFEFLAKEENVHFKFLQDQHYFLENPSSWHFDEEKWGMEG